MKNIVHFSYRALQYSVKVLCYLDNIGLMTVNITEDMLRNCTRSFPREPPIDKLSFLVIEEIRERHID